MNGYEAKGENLMIRKRFEVFTPPLPDTEIIIRYRCNWHGARIKELHCRFWSKAIDWVSVFVNGDIRRIKRRAIIDIKLAR
jgi:hypothetical protein